MPEIPREKGQFVQPGTVQIVPKINGSWLSVDGMVDFDQELLEEEYPILHAVLGNCYDDSGIPVGSFRTPKLDDWGLEEFEDDNAKYMIRF